MPQIAPYEFDTFVACATFLGDDPFFALADGTVRRMQGGETVIETNPAGLVVARRDETSNRILCGGEDGRVVALAADGQAVELASIGRKWISSVAGGPSGAVAFTSGRTVHVRLPDGTVKTHTHDRSAEDVAFAPKGMRVAFARSSALRTIEPIPSEPCSKPLTGARARRNRRRSVLGGRPLRR